jgi:tetrahydromethanopterin S-methyltransferase subunit G
MTNEEFPNDEGFRVWQLRRMDDLARRVEALEEELAQAWGEDPEQHPHLLDKKLGKLRARIDTLEEMLREVAGKVDALLASLGSGPSDGLN